MLAPILLRAKTRLGLQVHRIRRNPLGLLWDRLHGRSISPTLPLTATREVKATIRAVVTRADGRTEDLGVIHEGTATVSESLFHPPSKE